MNPSSHQNGANAPQSVFHGCRVVFDGVVPEFRETGRPMGWGRDVAPAFPEARGA